MSKEIMDKIRNLFIDKLKSGKFWENEFGMCNFTGNLLATHKMIYESEDDFKVQLKQKSTMIYFKIVPSYFSFPGGQYYWNYADGEINNGDIKFYENRYK